MTTLLCALITGMQARANADDVDTNAAESSALNSPKARAREPALELQLDSEGVHSSPSPSTTTTYTGSNVRGTKAGLAASCFIVAGGGAVIAAGIVASANQDDLGGAIGVVAIGTVLGTMVIIGGIVGIAITSRNLHSAHHRNGNRRANPTATVKKHKHWDPSIFAVRF